MSRVTSTAMPSLKSSLDHSLTQSIAKQNTHPDNPGQEQGRVLVESLLCGAAFLDPRNLDPRTLAHVSVNLRAAWGPCHPAHIQIRQTKTCHRISSPGCHLARSVQHSSRHPRGRTTGVKLLQSSAIARKHHQSYQIRTLRLRQLESKPRSASIRSAVPDHHRLHAQIRKSAFWISAQKVGF